MKPSQNRPSRHRGAWSILPWVVGILVIAGCVPGSSPPQFPGLYDVTRGTTKITIGWGIGFSEGQTTQQFGGGEIQPIDPNAVPPLLRPLAEAWNNGLARFNTELDEIFPNQVVVSHPYPWLVHVANPDDPNRFFEGLNTPNGFVAFGASMPSLDPNVGGGALGTNAVTGEWDGQDTITGEWKVSITLWGGNPHGGLVLTLAITVPYEAVRVPEDEE